MLGLTVRGDGYIGGVHGVYGGAYGCIRVLFTLLPCVNGQNRPFTPLRTVLETVLRRFTPFCVTAPLYAPLRTVYYYLILGSREYRGRRAGWSKRRKTV